MSSSLVLFSCLIILILDLVFIFIFRDDLSKFYKRLIGSIDRFFERFIIGPCPECHRSNVKIQSSEFVRSTYERYKVSRGKGGGEIEGTHIKHLYRDTCVCLDCGHTWEKLSERSVARIRDR